MTKADPDQELKYKLDKCLESIAEEFSKRSASGHLNAEDFEEFSANLVRSKDAVLSDYDLSDHDRKRLHVALTHRFGRWVEAFRLGRPSAESSPAEKLS